MKRNLLTILLTFFVAFSLNAQVDFVGNAKDFANSHVITPKSMTPMHAVKGVIFADDFESDMGWTLAGTWTRGEAVAEPDAAHSGTYILADPLGTDYPINMAREDVVSPVIDCTGESAVTLSYWSFSGCESSTWDHMGVEVYDGSAWNEIWSNGSSFQETAWTYYEFDVSAYADGNANFQVRFYMGTTDGSVTYSGWAIDDLVVFSPEADDLGADAVTPSGVVMTGSTVAPTVTVTNYGSSDQNSFDVNLTDGAGYDETVNVTYTLTVGSSYAVTMPDWTPADGTYTLTGTVILGGDANATNDVATSEVEVRGVGFGDVISTFVTEAGGCPGIETDGTNIYTVYWNPSASGRDFDKYTMDGVFVEEFAISGVSAVRDMAFNPNTGYFYGAAATTSLFEMDLANQSLISTITAATACRAIAYDDDDNTFWGNNWDTQFTEFNPDGSATGNSFAVTSQYGAAYDNWTDPANPTMWAFTSDGGTPVNTLIEYNMDGSLTGRQIDVSTVPGYDAGIGGGLASYADENAAYLLVNIQQSPNLIAKIFLADLSAQGDPNVTFAVDMNTQIMVGDFVPGTDVVYIAGSPWSWAAPGDDATLELLDGDADGIYEGTYTVTAGDIQYKYFQNAGWDGGEWPGDPNRMYTVTTSVTLNDLWAYEYLTTFTVTDGTNAVEGATIDVEATTYTATFSTTTDVNGLGYFATINGSYDYTVTMTGYETVTGSFDVDGANVPVNVVLTVGINEISSQINVYPNPSNGMFNINVDGAFDLEVYDITGKVINTQVVNGSTQIELDAAGVYFLRFSNEEGSVTQRVIVQ